MPANQRRPVLALAMGDPCGISPELTAKIMMDADVRTAADVIVIGDRRVLAEGETIAQLKSDHLAWRPGAPLAFDGKPVFVDLGHLDPASVKRGVSSREGGTFALTNFRAALRLAAADGADAVTFTPFNKHAMKLSDASYEDEIAVITRESGAASQRARVQYSRRAVECARHEPCAAEGRRPPHHARRGAQRSGADRPVHARRRLHEAAHRGRRSQSTRRR